MKTLPGIKTTINP